MAKRNTAMALLALMFWSTATAHGEEALVAVAANYAGAFDAIAKSFSEKTGHTIVRSTGSTGKLYAQITQGAPFDVLLAGDSQTPERLGIEGYAIADSRFTYAFGKLALWSKQEVPVWQDPKAALTARSTLKLAIANPELAPYGAAARETLQTMGLWELLQPKLVMGENIGQTFAMVETGGAQTGFVALSALISPERPAGGSHWTVPQEMYSPIRQDAILLLAGKDNPAAVAFLVFIKGEAARKISASFGYDSK